MPLLKQFKTPFGTVRITKARDGTLAYYQNGCFHSQANKRGVSVCAYVHVIHEIIRQKKSRKILIIGCGGGTTATMLSRLGCDVTVVDINPAAFTIAREYFQMPARVNCIEKNGLTFVRTTKQKFDAVIFDVFGADNVVPKGFTTKGFFGAAIKILRPLGMLIMNTMTHDDKDVRADAVAMNMQAAGINVTMVDWPGEKDRNTLIIGGSLRRVAIPSGREPAWIRHDLKGLIHRKPLKQTRKRRP